MPAEENSPYKWQILAMITLASVLVMGMPLMSMPVLFADVAQELGLTLGQIGIIWAMGSVGFGIFSVPGGLLGDRFGPRLVIGIGLILSAIVGGLRGISPDFITLATFMFLFGIAINIAYPNMPKIIGLFFPPEQLATANGIAISGFGIGGMLATALSAGPVLSILGNWRNVLFFYAAIALTFGFLWFALVKKPKPGQTSVATHVTEASVTFGDSINRVIRTKALWLLTVAALGGVGCFTAVSGYLPIYLENSGIQKSLADTMVSTNYLASIPGAIIVPMISDRMGRRKSAAIVALVLLGISIYLMSIPNQSLLWVVIPLFGFAAQGAFPLFLTLTLETRGIGAAYGGTAIGVILVVVNFGAFAATTIGGQLAEINQIWPFIFWTILVFTSIIAITFVKETGAKAHIQRTN